MPLLACKEKPAFCRIPRLLASTEYWPAARSTTGDLGQRKARCMLDLCGVWRFWFVRTVEFEVLQTTNTVTKTPVTRTLFRLALLPAFVPLDMCSVGICRSLPESQAATQPAIRVELRDPCKFSEPSRKNYGLALLNIRRARLLHGRCSVS